LKVKYIGVLGSKSKIKSMFKEMGKNSVDKAFLHTLDAPIGIPINSITPAEIAISIAAKVISIKNKATF
jgi:xanthine dehydrogenase accessory factor